MKLEVFNLLENNIQNYETVNTLPTKPKVEDFVAFDNSNDEGLNQEEWNDGELERKVLFLLQQKVGN